MKLIYKVLFLAMLGIAGGALAQVFSGMFTAGIGSGVVSNPVQAQGGGGASFGTYSALPAGSTGALYKTTDSELQLIYQSGAWQPFWSNWEVTLPVTANFGWQSQGGATVATAPGGIELSQVNNEGSFNIHAYVQNVPATPYHVIMGYKGYTIASGNNGVGVCLSDGTKYLLFYNPFATVNYGVGGLVVFSATNSTTYGGNTYVNQPFAMTSDVLWVRLGDNGTNATWDVGTSPNGPWTNLYTETDTTFLTPTKIGVFLNGGPSSIRLFDFTITG